MPDDPSPEVPERLWTVEEANGRLPALKELLPQMGGWVHRLRAIHEELKRLGSFWGKEIHATDHPDRELTHRLEGEFKTLTQRLENEVARLHHDGIELKDLDDGLVDFFARIDGEIVYLCWRQNEPEVGFYHTLSGGFRTRRPLTEGRSRALPRPRSGPASP
jgi:hypothetical protein